MCKKLVFLISFVLVLNLFVGTAQVFSLPIIISIAERNVDTDATDTPAQIAAPFEEEAVAFVDRTHQYEVLPPELPDLVGAEYIMTANDNKNQSAYELDVVLSQSARVYVIVDNRMGSSDGGQGVDPDISGMPWLGTMGFVDTGYDIGIDESADGDIDQWSSFFVNTFPAGTVTIHGCTQGHGGNMLGVVVTPPPTDASNPDPAQDAIDVPVDTALCWSPGAGAALHQIYFGTDAGDLLLVAVQPVGTTGTDCWDPPVDLIASTTYYWQIVEVNGLDVSEGSIWNFTTVRGECQPDFPKDGAVIPGAPMGDDVYTTLDFFPGATNVEWTGYFHYDYDKVDSRAQDANLGPPPYGGYRYYAGLYAVPPWTESLVRGTIYYWTVDSKDSRGNMFPGDVWEFAVQGYYAFAPTPPNEATFINTDVRLAWKPGFGAVEHDIYLGTSYEAVRDARYDFNEPTDSNGDPYVGPDEYYTSRSEPNVMVTGLPYLTKHYWRVDEVKGRVPPPVGGGTYYFGPVWNFATLPEGIGTVTGALFNGISGTDISLLYADPRFPYNPDQTQELTSFDSETVLPDLSSYGGMIHGWLYVAKSGYYTFWLATDDDGDLWLSSDDSPDNIQLIAYIRAYSSTYEWYDSGEPYQVSAPIWLNYGQKYYIRACWKEEGGGDHCMVAWQGPDQPLAPVSGSAAQVIPGSRLSPFRQLWAHSPEPQNGQAGVASPVTLRWGPGDTAAKHDVYLSTSRALVDSRDASAFKGRFDPNSYGPIVLDTGQLYYWAIDEVNDLGPSPGIWPGKTWLFRAAGGAGGLQGLFYHWDGILPPQGNLPYAPGPANPFQIFVMSRIDPEINFTWPDGTTPGTNSPDPNINTNDFACRWVGHLECPADANYTFYLSTDDGGRLFIDGQKLQLIELANPTHDSWQQQGMGADDQWRASIVLSAGLHDIEMHQYEHEGAAGAELRWSSDPVNPSDPAISMQIIPSIWLWPPLFATGPNPPHLSTVDNRKPALEWIPGLYAVTHELYFSANYDDVNDRNPLVRQILIDPCRPYPAMASPLQLGKTYYWCVDEIKSVTERWNARSVWEFTVNECISIDNFEDYNDRGELRLVWTDGYANVIWGGSYPYHYVIQGGSSGSNLNLSSAVGSYTGGTGPVPSTPLNYDAMVLRYDNDGLTYTGLPGAEKWIYDAPYFSEIEKDTVSADWSGEGVKSLSLWFQGHPLSDGDYNSTAWPLYTVSGRGRDIWGRHDEFYYLSVYPLKGSGTVQVKITGMDNTDPWAKAGVMIRDKWAPYSKFAAVYMTPGNGVTFQWRENEGAVCDSITKPGVTVPQYLKLERTFSGNFIAKHSGTTAIVWEDVNSTTAPEQPVILMGVDDPNIYVGTAVTSHDALETCTASFDTMQVIATPAPTTWIAGNIGTNDANQLYVALSDSTKTVVVNHPDPCAATLTDWQEWNIELTDFVGLDLSDVQKVHIGVGDRVNHPEPGGSGALYIDDISACPPRCVPSYGKPLADIAQPYDCVVDEKDIMAMAYDWLLSDELIVTAVPGAPILHWAFDQGTGTTAIDSAGTTHGTIVGADWITPGANGAGYCLNFNGVGDYVQVPDGNDANAVLGGLSAISVSVWVKSDVTNTDKGFIICEQPDGSDETITIRYDAAGASYNGTNLMKMGITTTGGVQQLEASENSQSTDWQHLVMTWSSGQIIRFYIDGFEDTPTGRDDGIVGTITDVTALIVGKGGKDTAPNQGWDGLIDDLRIYNYALSEEEIVYLATDGATSLHIPIVSDADLYQGEPQGSQWINLKDYSIIAEQYLEKILWP